MKLIQYKIIKKKNSTMNLIILMWQASTTSSGGLHGKIVLIEENTED